MNNKPILYEALPFQWTAEKGTNSEAYFVIFDTFSVFVKWNKVDSNGYGRITRFGKGKGDITELSFPKEVSNSDQAKQFMQDKAMEILAKYFKEVSSEQGNLQT